jgi:hypothetical protein
MINQDVLKYINDELAKGTSREVITSNLMAGGGWTMEDVVFHFGFAKATPTVAPKALEVKIPSPPSPAVVAPTITPTPAPTLSPTPEPQKQPVPDLQSVINNITATPITTEKPISPATSPASSPLVSNTFASIKANRPKAKSPVFKVLVINIVGALLIVGAGLGYKYYLNYESMAVTPAPVASPSPIPTPDPVPAVTPPSEVESNETITTKQEQKVAVTFEDQLSACTKYKTTFVHPFSGETLEKEILGIISEKCNYIEQMPNGGKMECKYTESERMAAAQYYRDVNSAESAETSASSDIGSGNQKTTYKVNGKMVENPLQEAMDSGVCVITGY